MSNAIVRRLVVACATGWKRQRRTADIASRSNSRWNSRGASVETTRTLFTLPSGCTVNSTCTLAVAPTRWAADG